MSARLSLRVVCENEGCRQNMSHERHAPFYAASPVPERAKDAHDRTAQWFKASAESAWPHSCSESSGHKVAIIWTDAPAVRS